jgi:hypothetical protein
VERRGFGVYYDSLGHLSGRERKIDDDALLHIN